MKLAAARIFVRNLPMAIEFYEQSLGFRVQSQSAEFGYAVFEAGGVDLVVEAVATEAPADDQVLVGRFSGLSFEVSDIAAACSALEQQGVRIAARPERQAWGGTLATVEDPSGNALQLVQYPAAA